MLIEQGLMTFLLSQTDLTQHVGERIYFVRADQDTQAPYIVVTKVSAIREHSHDGSSGLAHPRFQLAIFSTTYSMAKTIATALQTILDGYTGLMDEVTVQAVFYDNETDSYESDTGLFMITADYLIWHIE